MKNSSRIIGGVLILCIVLTTVFIVLLTTPPESIVEDEEVLVEDPQPIVEDEEVLFEDVRQGSDCGVLERIEQKITDLETWEVLWAEMERGYIPVDQTPRIEFSTNVLFAVFQGECPTSGYTTTITRIVLTSTGYVVFVDEVHPGPDCGTLQALTQPHHIVVAPSLYQNLPVQFVYNITTYDCDP